MYINIKILSLTKLTTYSGGKRSHPLICFEYCTLHNRDKFTVRIISNSLSLLAASLYRELVII